MRHSFELVLFIRQSNLDEGKSPHQGMTDVKKGVLVLDIHGTDYPKLSGNVKGITAVLLRCEKWLGLPVLENREQLTKGLINICPVELVNDQMMGFSLPLKGP